MLGPQTQHKGTVYGDDGNAPKPAHLRLTQDPPTFRVKFPIPPRCRTPRARAALSAPRGLDHRVEALRSCSLSCARPLCYARRRRASSRTRARLRGERHTKLPALAGAPAEAPAEAPPGHASRHTRSSRAHGVTLGGPGATPRALYRPAARRSSLLRGSSRARGAPVALRARRTSLSRGRRSPCTGRRSCWLPCRLGAGRPLAPRCLRSAGWRARAERAWAPRCLRSARSRRG